MRKRCEVARAVGIVFQEEPVVVRAAEQHLGHRLVAARREPRGAEVAAANVCGDGHVGGLHLKDAVDHVNIVARNLVNVDALGGVRLALGRIAELAPACVVELQVAAAAVVERAHGVAVHFHDVVEQHALVLVALGGAIRRLAAHARDQVQHRRRGNGQLRGVVAGNVAQRVEVGQERMVAERNLPAEHQLRALGLGALELHRPRVGVNVLHVLKRLKEVEVPHGAAELAVGDGLQARLLLLFHQLGDGLVLGGGQRLARDGAGGEIGARLFQRLGAQEAADDVIAVRRVRCGHGGHPFVRCCVPQGCHTGLK